MAELVVIGAGAYLVVSKKGRHKVGRALSGLGDRMQGRPPHGYPSAPQPPAAADGYGAPQYAPQYAPQHLLQAYGYQPHGYQPHGYQPHAQGGAPSPYYGGNAHAQGGGYRQHGSSAEGTRQRRDKKRRSVCGSRVIPAGRLGMR